MTFYYAWAVYVYAGRGRNPPRTHAVFNWDVSCFKVTTCFLAFPWRIISKLQWLKTYSLVQALNSLQPHQLIHTDFRMLDFWRGAWVEEHKWPRKQHERHQWGKRYLTMFIQSCLLQGCGSWSRKYAFNIWNRGRIHPRQHHSVTQEHPFSKKFWLTTGSPQTMPLVQHSLDNTKRRTVTIHHNHTLTIPWMEQIHHNTVNNLSYTLTVPTRQTVPSTPPWSPPSPSLSLSLCSRSNRHWYPCTHTTHT